MGWSSWGSESSKVREVAHPPPVGSSFTLLSCTPARNVINTLKRSLNQSTASTRRTSASGHQVPTSEGTSVKTLTVIHGISITKTCYHERGQRESICCMIISCQSVEGSLRREPLGETETIPEQMMMEVDVPTINGSPESCLSSYYLFSQLYGVMYRQYHR